MDELENNADVFSKTLTIFDDAVEISNPASDGFSLDVALAYVPLSHGMKSRVMAGELKLLVGNFFQTNLFIQNLLHFRVSFITCCL